MNRILVGAVLLCAFILAWPLTHSHAQTTPIGAVDSPALSGQDTAAGADTEGDETLAAVPAVSATEDAISSLPNLTPYKPTGWSDKIVVSKVTGTNSDAGSLTADDTLYLDWAVINNGASMTLSRFYTKLYVDGVYRTSWYLDPPLYVNSYEDCSDYSLGKLTAGTHTLRIEADSGGAIVESNEADNTYTKTITVLAGIPTGGSLRVTISPQEAIDAGAQWRRSGTPIWRSSGDTESSIPAGSYMVEFRAVAGWREPVDHQVTITNGGLVTLGRAYTLQHGTLQVTINPSSIAYYAQWSVDGGNWESCSFTNYGYTYDLAVGSHTVAFKPISRWSAPDSQVFTIADGQTTPVTATYSPVFSPSAGAVWAKKAKSTILWNTDGFQFSGRQRKLRIELWQNGVFVRKIAAATPNDGFQAWRVPNTRTFLTGGGFRIRVYALKGSGDALSSEFSIGQSASLSADAAASNTPETSPEIEALEAELLSLGQLPPSTTDESLAPKQ